MHDVNNDSKATAIANLHMLMQYATGETKPKRADDSRVRYERVLAFLMTGTCVVDADIQQMAKDFEAVSLKSPARQPVAA